MEPSIASHDTKTETEEASARDVEKGALNENGAAQAEPEEPKAADPNIVDWDGPDDPENPMNWSSRKKATAIAIVAIITFLSPLTSTIIAPATAEVMETFHSTDATLGAFVTSVYLLGYTSGPLVLAPLSELYGRQIVYNVCNLLFLIWTIACAVANNMAALIVFRLFSGIASSCAITLGAGTIADMIVREKRGAAMALWLLGPLVGPTVGPLIGGYLASAKGWRWLFWLVAICAGAIMILTFVFMQESYAYVILQKKTKRLQKETGNPNLRSALDTGKTPKEQFKVAIVRPLKMLVLSPIVFLMSLHMAIVYGYLYLLFTTFPRIFEGQYGFHEKNIGLTYLGSGIGSFCGLSFMGLASDRILVALTKRNGGVAKPEYRLPAMFIGAVLVPCALFLYGWTAYYKVHWIVPIIGTAMLGAGMFTIFMPCQTYLVDAYTIYAASVTAAATVLRSLVGALLPLAGDSMYDALGVQWGTSLLGFIAVAFIPVPLIFWMFGERIRESKFAKVEF
ncbi:MFS general substrate transporter [Lophiostoma macrostomum CBS 122681]|uniref:MFS general substrate transporter n=1 Tax=Lophiostoma macrostomum CBS 122681 TaxID=1314788 RepID=A0A6A6TIL8_9PLEO|nr:MFS general substrate transporter [Lophiostoma macrostomum CBS 122681]